MKNNISPLEHHLRLIRELNEAIKIFSSKDHYDEFQINQYKRRKEKKIKEFLKFLQNLDPEIINIAKSKNFEKA